MGHLTMALRKQCRFNHVQHKKVMEGFRAAMKERKLHMVGILVAENGSRTWGVTAKQAE